jgi:hypothetical protein
LKQVKKKLKIEKKIYVPTQEELENFKRRVREN